MELNFTLTRRKRTVLFYSAMILLLQTIAPAFHGALAQSAQGYTGIVCTMYGPVEVFVKFEADDTERERGCEECTQCILQANLNKAAFQSHYLLDARLRPLSPAKADPIDTISNLFPYASFHSRAPPR